MNDYIIELKDDKNIEKLYEHGFVYSPIYDGYVKYYDTGLSIIRFVVSKTNYKSNYILYVDSNMCEFFTKDRILRLLKYLNIEDLFKEVKE